MKQTFLKNEKYIGKDVLDEMAFAENYNKFISNEIIKAFNFYFYKTKKPKIIDFGAGLGQFSTIFKKCNVDFKAIEICISVGNTSFVDCDLFT